MEKAIGTHILALNSSGASTPEYLHLLPVSQFSGVDGRGPYAAPDMQALISAFEKDGLKLPIDENHSTDLAAKQGFPAPARGWIVGLQAREDGLYGKVEWTPEGRELVSSEAYGFISPVFQHSARRPYQIAKMMRASLTNDPNLKVLKSLHSTEENDMLEELRKALGLPETSDEAAVMAAVTAAHTAQQAHTALMSRIATAAGVANDTDPDALVTAIQSRGADRSEVVQQLTTQITALQSQLTTLSTTTARDKAEAKIDEAISAGKIVPALRDHMIARHMKNPTEVETEIGVMISLNAGGLGGRKAPETGQVITAEDDKIIAMMGVDPTAFADQAKALHGKGQ